MAATLLRNVKEVATDLYKALKRTLGFEVDKNQKYDYSTFKDLSKKVNKKYERDKSDDFELWYNIKEKLIWYYTELMNL